MVQTFDGNGKPHSDGTIGSQSSVRSGGAVGSAISGGASLASLASDGPASRVASRCASFAWPASFEPAPFASLA